MRGLATMLAAAFLFALGPAAAQTPPAPAPAPGGGNDLVNALAACRGIGDAARRLACYDDAATRLTQAVSRNDLVVLNREDIRQTHRSLFGFHLPRLPIFGHGGGSAEQADEAPAEITATIASVRSLGYDKWQIRLEDGAIWQTTESSSYIQAPHAGNSVVIRRGPLGSYLIRIQGQRAVRAMRTG
jgi:hypothetical protein